MSSFQVIAENYKNVSTQISKAAKDTRRNTADVELVVVTKNHRENTFLNLLDAGHRVFGENRVLEAMEKWLPLKQRFTDIRLHLIGPLQSNKVNRAIKIFDVIETVDRAKIAQKIVEELERQDRLVECYIQLNTGEEVNKGGVFPAAADDFISKCINEIKLPVTGLMCIPPKSENPKQHFEYLSRLAFKYKLKNLSMGMSEDFVLAINAGATAVRIGTAILGNRNI